MLTLPLLLGCASTDTATDDTDKPVEAVPYIYEDDDPAVPTLTADDVAVLLDEALAKVWLVNAEPVFPAYHAVMDAADEGCPNYYEYDGSEYWYDDCTSDGGAAFSGYAFDVVYTDYAYGDGVLNGEALYGVGSATAPDGTTLSFGGSATFYTVTPNLPVDDPDYYINGNNQVQGGFAYDGAGAEGTWLGEGEAPDLITVSYYLPAYDGRYSAVDGAVSAADGTTIVFDLLYLYSANLVPDCPDEPYGGMSVRDADGEWYDVIFHGPAEYGDPVDTALCDGCGDVYFHGELIGSACGDFATLNNWEGTPWS